MNTAGIDPAVIEVKQRAHGDGVVDSFVGIADLVQRLHIFELNIHGISIYFANESHECLFRFGETRGLDIGEDAIDEFPAPQEFRRDRGVRLRSKRTGVEM